MPPLTAAVALSFPALMPAQEVRDLGLLRGLPTEAAAVSDAGAVVVGSAGGARAFRWTEAGGMQDLGALGGGAARAVDVSADGAIVVGESVDASGATRAFRWTASGGMVDLGTLGGAHSTAAAVARSGLYVLGFAEDAVGARRAVLWDTSLVCTPLDPVGGASIDHLGDVSDDGRVVVGALDVGGGARHAFRWIAGSGVEDLGALPSPWPDAAATGVSADGALVVGYSVRDYEPRPFTWTSAAGMVELSAPAGVHFVRAVDVAGGGDVLLCAGARAVTFEPLALRWTALTGMQALGSASGAPLLARGLASDGAAIVGALRSATGEERAFLWRRTPGLGEPVCSDAAPNRMGSTARLHLEGDAHVAANDVRLLATGLQPGTFAVALASPTLARIPAPAGAGGVLCLGRPLGLYAAPGAVQRADSAGAFGLTLDLRALPTPYGPVSAQPGEAWFFQVWYRDAAPASSGFSDGVGLQFR